MRMLLIEETSPGRYRLANGPMTLEVYGSSVEDVLDKASEEWAHVRNGFTAAQAIDSLMGERETVSWNKNGAEVEGHPV